MPCELQCVYNGIQHETKWAPDCAKGTDNALRLAHAKNNKHSTGRQVWSTFLVSIVFLAFILKILKIFTEKVLNTKIKNIDSKPRTQARRECVRASLRLPAADL